MHKNEACKAQNAYQKCKVLPCPFPFYVVFFKAPGELLQRVGAQGQVKGLGNRPAPSHRGDQVWKPQLGSHHTKLLSLGDFLSGEGQSKPQQLEDFDVLFPHFNYLR